MHDIDYEIYKYINELADQYVETDELLKRNHLTFDEALQQAKQFKETFYALLEKYSISSQSLVVICYELMEHISQQPDNPDFQYLYLCVMTDFCLLVRTELDPDEEQKIRNYVCQQELMRELTRFWESLSENIRKYRELLEYLKKPIILNDIANCTIDVEKILHITRRRRKACCRTVTTTTQLCAKYSDSYV